MQHVKVTFKTTDALTRDIIMAMLGAHEYMGFEEVGDDTLIAYTDEAVFSEEVLKDLVDTTRTRYEMEVVPAQNWNALWESNFEPVVVKDFCTIRADFHDIKINTEYDIVITPKMSFGTGHHATTQQVIMLMKDVAFSGGSVLDFGTGTGVLAILAEMLGAKEVLAIDTDEWSVNNAIENIARNNCSHIVVKEGSLEDAPIVKTDIILANINRNILLQYMAALYERLGTGGTIIMSGLLTDDRDFMLDAAKKEGFHFDRATELNGWIAIMFTK